MFAHTARAIAAGSLVLAASASVAAASASQDADTCRAAVAMASQLPEHHGHLVATRAAYGIAQDEGMTATVRKLAPKLQRLQADYTQTLGAYQAAAGDCRS